jgi:NAD(P)H-dependent FMN reductase
LIQHGERSVTIQVILASTRPGRQDDQVARWMHAQASARPGLQVELIDVRDWPLPFFEGHRASPIATAWAQKVSQADGYVLVTHVYNPRCPAVLKNAPLRELRQRAVDMQVILVEDV